MKLKRFHRGQKEHTDEMEQRTRSHQHQDHYDYQSRTSLMQRPYVDDLTNISQHSSSQSTYAVASDGPSRQEHYQQLQMYPPSDAVQKQERKPVRGGRPMSNYANNRQHNMSFTDGVEEINATRGVDAPSTTPRRKKRRSSRHKQVRARSSFSTDTEFTYLSSHADLFSWRKYLPQSMDDSTIVDSVQKIFVLAEQYVNNFYIDCKGRKAQSVPFFERQGLSHLLADVETDVLMYSVAHPTILIKHSLVASLLNVISLETQYRWPSLLPDEFLCMTKAIRQSDVIETETLHWNEALAAHRVLSYYIRKNITQDTSYLKLRNESINEIVGDIEIAFAPWESEERTIEQRGPILFALFEEAADLGIALFSQASTFHFDWCLKPSKSGALDIAITPRLYKFFDENAQPIDEPQHMIRMKVERTVKEIDIPESPVLLTTKSPHHINNSVMLPRGVWSLAASDDSQRDVAELSAEAKGIKQLRLSSSGVHPDKNCQLIEHDSAGGFRDPLATISGPSLNEPDYENANGENLSLAVSPTSYNEVTVQQFHSADIHGPLSSHSRKRSASIDVPCADNVPYLTHKYNEFTALSQQQVLSHGQPVDKSPLTAASPLGNSQTRRKPPPPNSFPIHLMEKAPVRSESKSRGRSASRSSLLRNRSRSEPRGLHTSSEVQHPLARPAEVDVAKLQASFNNPAQLYAEKRAAHGRTREDRDPVTITNHLIPEGDPCSADSGGLPRAFTNNSAIHHANAAYEQVNLPVMPHNGPKPLPPPPTQQALGMSSQGSAVSGWLRGIGKFMKGDADRYQQRVTPM